MKHFAVNNFAKAALVAGGTALAAISGAAQAQHPQLSQHPDPLTMMNGSPACLAFDHADRNGIKFNQPDLHRYDEAMRAFNQALSSYSGWDELRERFARLGRTLNGVCVQSHEQNLPIIIDGQMGAIHINIRTQTPWGPGLATPENMQGNLDALVYLTTMALAGKASAIGLNSPVFAPDTRAFLNSFTIASGQAEAFLATMERGLAENRLEDLDKLLLDQDSPFYDETAALYQKAAATGIISAQDRAEFKIAIIRSMIENPTLRDRNFQEIALQMQDLAKRGVNIAAMFNMVPPDEILTEELEKRFGAIARVTIDGKPLMQAYLDYWKDHPNDPAVETREQFEEFRAYVGMMHELKQQQQQEEQQQNDALPRPPATPGLPQKPPALNM